MRASHASYWRRSSRSRRIAAALLDGLLAILLPHCFQSRDHLGAQGLWLPERTRRHDDSRRVLEALHPDPGLVERSAQRHRAMIGKEQRVRTLRFEIRNDPITQIDRKSTRLNSSH